jgi:hypothetical protein
MLTKLSQFVLILIWNSVCHNFEQDRYHMSSRHFILRRLVMRCKTPVTVCYSVGCFSPFKCSYQIGIDKSKYKIYISINVKIYQRSRSLMCILNYIMDNLHNFKHAMIDIKIAISLK